jgi:hypothetical protein
MFCDLAHNCVCPQNRSDTKALLEELLSSYSLDGCETSNLASSQIEGYPISSQDVISVREQAFDLLTFLHPEIRRGEAGGRGQGKTGAWVCILVKALLNLGVKSYVDLRIFVTVDDVESMKLPQDLAAAFKNILVRMTERQTMRDVQEQEQETIQESKNANKKGISMSAHDANLVFTSRASLEHELDTIGRVIVRDGLTRFEWQPAWSLEKLAGLLHDGATGSLPIPVLERAVVAFGLMLASSDPVLLLNDQGNACTLEDRLCVCGFKKCRPLQQCGSCRRLQGDVDRYLVPAHYRHQHLAIASKAVVTDGTITSLVKLMGNSHSPSLQAGCAYCIHNVAKLGQSAEDPQIDFGNAVTALTAAMEEHKWDSRVQSCAMHTLSFLLGSSRVKEVDWASDELESLAVPHNLENGQMRRIIQEVTEVLLVHRRDLALQRLGCRCLFYLTCIGDVRVEVIEGWGVEALVRCMQLPKIDTEDGSLQTYCCLALRQLSHDAISCKRIVVVGGVNALVSALRLLSVLSDAPKEVMLPLKALLALSQKLHSVEDESEAKMLDEAVPVAEAVPAVYDIVAERSCFEARHHAVLCQTIHALASGNCHARASMMKSGVREHLERSLQAYANDATVQRWASKCVSLLTPPKEGSACCSVQ